MRGPLPGALDIAVRWHSPLLATAYCLAAFHIVSIFLTWLLVFLLPLRLPAPSQAPLLVLLGPLALPLTSKYQTAPRHILFSGYPHSR